jgi:putative addiction module killer protein
MQIRQTAEFVSWLDDLRDILAKRRIATRIIRMQSGLLGDVKSVGDGVSEARIDYGPGYRLYFTRRGQEIIILLVGGDKGSQQKDIERAKDLVGRIP